MEYRRGNNENGELEDALLSAVANEEFAALQIPEAVDNPYLLLLGGFQGSGKTTTIRNLASELAICVISHDRLRHRLLNKTGFVPGSPAINTTKLKLLNRVLPFDVPITIDANTTPGGIEVIRQSIISSQRQYRVVTFFLDANPETLRARIISRAGNPNLGMHLGTLQELEKTMHDLEEMDRSVYDYVLNTEVMQQEEIIAEIKNKLR